MKIIKTSFLPKHVTAMAVFPFVLARGELNQVIVNHERIHLRQQLELFILPFYFLYVVEYLIRLTQYRNHDKAYRNISFEREAYENEKNIEYLKMRKNYRWIRYLKK